MFIGKCSLLISSTFPIFTFFGHITPSLGTRGPWPLIWCKFYEHFVIFLCYFNIIKFIITSHLSSKKEKRKVFFFQLHYLVNFSWLLSSHLMAVVTMRYYLWKTELEFWTYNVLHIQNESPGATPLVKIIIWHLINLLDSTVDSSQMLASFVKVRAKLPGFINLLGLISQSLVFNPQIERSQETFILINSQNLY